MRFLAGFLAGFGLLVFDRARGFLDRAFLALDRDGFFALDVGDFEAGGSVTARAGASPSRSAAVRV